MQIFIEGMDHVFVRFLKERLLGGVIWASQLKREYVTWWMGNEDSRMSSSECGAVQITKMALILPPTL